MKVYIICYIPVKIAYFEKDMGQNALGKSDCRLFKSNISLEQNDEIGWFYACSYSDSKIGCISKSQEWVWLFKSWDSVVSQEWIDELSWFFACWYNFRKAKIN